MEDTAKHLKSAASHYLRIFTNLNFESPCMNCCSVTVFVLEMVLQNLQHGF